MKIAVVGSNGRVGSLVVEETTKKDMKLLALIIMKINLVVKSS